MNLDDVAEQIRAALGTIDGLSTPEWGVQRISEPPAAVVALPEQVEYDSTYARGMDRIADWQVVVLVPHPTRPESRRQIAAYADGAGDKSVKAAIEAYTYTACDSVTVSRADFDAVSYAGTEYLAAMFHLDVAGRGGA